MSEPIQKVEPPTFASSQQDQDTSSNGAVTPENEVATEEEIEVDVEMSQQSQFSAFTDGGSTDC